LPSADALFFSLSSVLLDIAANAQKNPEDSFRADYHLHPYGEINLVVPLNEGPTLAGPNGWCYGGWTAPVPGSHHFPKSKTVLSSHSLFCLQHGLHSTSSRHSSEALWGAGKKASSRLTSEGRAGQAQSEKSMRRFARNNLRHSRRLVDRPFMAEKAVARKLHSWERDAPDPQVRRAVTGSPTNSVFLSPVEDGLGQGTVMVEGRPASVAGEDYLAPAQAANGLGNTDPLQ
jgi:Domain of unknown function (DUF4863)